MWLPLKTQRRKEEIGEEEGIGGGEKEEKETKNEWKEGKEGRAK